MKKTLIALSTILLTTTINAEYLMSVPNNFLKGNLIINNESNNTTTPETSEVVLKSSCLEILNSGASRDSITQGQVPNCTTIYSNFINGVNERPYCDNNQRSAGSKVNSVSGWQVDIFGSPYCWLMRSTSLRSTYPGSGLCQNSGVPNATKHGFLWMR